LRWREVRELSDRQGGNYDGARQNDQQSANGGEYRPSYEEVNEHEKAQSGFRLWASGFRWRRPE